MRAVLIVCLMSLAIPAAADDSPNDVIESAVAELAAAFDGRQEELANDVVALKAVIDKVLLPRFDSKYAAQLVLGRHWRDASPEQRERFINAFYQAMVRKYSDGVKDFDQDKVEILAYRGDPSKPRTTVRTIVELENGNKVPVNYGLVKRDSGWKIFDVTIEGISYVRNFRAELDSEISSTSLEQVISRYESEAGITSDE
ncbi:MAG TPA: ABC transporter substrate-binding protein [Woeseiaceae bacterium]|nr:ABC transporter substrate-binding protein [Woeseiaceae bacterium]